MLEDAREKTVRQLQRYHITTAGLLTASVLAGLRVEQVRATLGQLERDKQVQSYPLPGGQKYYIITRRFARQLGMHRRSSRPLGTQSLVAALGAAYFCVRAGFKKFTSKEFAEHFPDLCRAGLPCGNYFIDREGRLGWIHVDHGASTRRVLNKTNRIIGNRYKVPAFVSDILKKRRFLIAVVTPTEGKKAALENVLDEHGHRLVTFQVHVVPEIADILLQE